MTVKKKLATDTDLILTAVRDLALRVRQVVHVHLGKTRQQTSLALSDKRPVLLEWLPSWFTIRHQPTNSLLISTH